MATRPLYPWEVDTPWDEPPDADRIAGTDSSEDEAVDWGRISQEDAGEEFACLLIALKQEGVLSAKQACLLAFFASKAGAVGRASDIGFKPDSASGHYSRHFDTVFPTAERIDFYGLPTPWYTRADTTRKMLELPVVPPHECLTWEIQMGGSSLRDQLRKCVANKTLPPCYFSHPVVVSAPADVDVYPVAIYCDGVKITRHESVLCFFYYNMVSETRHMIAAFRKTEMCRCGCKGWCTLHPLFSFLRWTNECGAQGVYPSTRHDGTSFSEGDRTRSAMAGRPLGHRFAVTLIKGDWAELTVTYAFPTLASTHSPCPLCRAPDKESLYQIAGVSALSTAYPRKTTQDIEVGCRACEIVVRPTPAQLRNIVASSSYDKRAGRGAAGLCLHADIPELNLQKGDRVEPSSGLTNIANLPMLPAGEAVTFWRKSNETTARRRNPIWCEAIGVTPERTMAVDWLHTLSLGCWQFTLSELVARLIRANVWKLQQRSAEERFVLSTSLLRAELYQWYRREKRAGRTPTEVQNLLPTMLGTLDDPKLGLHASETNHFMRFAETLINDHYDDFTESEIFLKLVRGACRIMGLIEEHPDVFPPPAIQEGALAAASTDQGADV